MRKLVLGFTALAGLSVAATASQAQDITVGFVTSLSGPASSIGLNYEKGMKAAYAYKSEIDGHKIKMIKLDDGSDPSAATKKRASWSSRTTSTSCSARRARRAPTRC